MKAPSLFAPLLRGALIAQTGRPWFVSHEPQDIAKESAGLAVTLDADAMENDATAARQLAEAFENSRHFAEGAAPLRIRISSDGGVCAFLCAPTCEGVEKIRRGERMPECTPANRDANAAPAGALEDRVALVTGGARGFGEEIAGGLAAAGAFVFIADLDKQRADTVAATLNARHGKPTALPLEVNVADEASVRAMMETVALTAGGIDLCVSNAGVLRAASILEQDMADFRAVTDINYTAFAIITKHCGRIMKTQHAAAPAWTTDIIQINSKSGLEGSDKNAAYAGSKFGGIGLVQSFAKELVEHNIKVNAVCPGNFFDGPLWADPRNGLFVQYLKTGKVPGAKTVADVRTFYEQKVPMKRGCTGADILKAVLYLVGQTYETGQALPVTGGQIMLG